MAYINPEAFLVSFVQEHFPGMTVTSELPYNMQFQVPLIVVERVGGPDDVMGFDRPTFAVNVFGADRASALSLAEQVRHLLRFVLPGRFRGGASASRVQTLAPPSIQHWDNTSVRRAVANYAVSLHQPI